MNTITLHMENRADNTAVSNYFIDTLMPQANGDTGCVTFHRSARPSRQPGQPQEHVKENGGGRRGGQGGTRGGGRVVSPLLALERK